MKTSILTTLATFLFLGTTAAAQEIVEPVNPPNVTILQMSWHKEMINPRRDPNPLAANEAQMRQAKAEKRVITRRENRPNETVQESMPVVVAKPVTERDAPFPIYRYNINVKNSGRKTITTLYWEYQFLDPDTNEVMGNRQMFSRMNLTPGKTHQIKAKSLRQPTVIVSAAQLDKKYRDQFRERLIIHRIHYSDGTAWQRDN